MPTRSSPFYPVFLEKKKGGPGKTSWGWLWVINFGFTILIVLFGHQMLNDVLLINVGTDSLWRKRIDWILVWFKCDWTRKQACNNEKFSKRRHIPKKKCIWTIELHPALNQWFLIHSSIWYTTARLWRKIDTNWSLHRPPSFLHFSLLKRIVLIWKTFFKAIHGMRSCGIYKQLARLLWQTTSARSK